MQSAQAGRIQKEKTMGAPSLAESVLDHGYVIQELLKTMRIGTDEKNLAAFVTISSELTQILVLAEKRSSESDQQAKRRRAVMTAQGVLFPKQAPRG